MSKIISTSVLIKSMLCEDNTILEYSCTLLKERFCNNLDAYITEFLSTGSGPISELVKIDASALYLLISKLSKKDRLAI